MIHATADISKEAKIGKDVRIWHQAQVREGAVIGDRTILSKNVYVCAGVQIGSDVKIQNNVSVYQGVTIEGGVFVGPHVCFTNDNLPRAITPDGKLKAGATAGNSDWSVSETLVKYGASIGANSTIIAGINIGRFALIGAGSVVTRDVPDYGLVYGNPARLKGFVCECARKLEKLRDAGAFVVMSCPHCRKEFEISSDIFSSVGRG